MFTDLFAFFHVEVYIICLVVVRMESPEKQVVRNAQPAGEDQWKKWKRKLIIGEIRNITIGRHLAYHTPVKKSSRKYVFLNFVLAYRYTKKNKIVLILMLLRRSLSVTITTTFNSLSTILFQLFQAKHDLFISRRLGHQEVGRNAMMFTVEAIIREIPAVLGSYSGKAQSWSPRAILECLFM